MSYLRAIKRFSGADNIGGIIQLQVARAADVVSIPHPVAGVIAGDITFQLGRGFVTWDCILETGKIKSASRSSREGAIKSNSLEFLVPKDRQSIKYQLDLAEEDELIVVYKDSNGTQFLFGTKENPVRFEYDHESGAGFSNLNNYGCRFFYDGPDNRYFYDGAIATPTPGTGTSTVQFASGELIALLNPSDELIVSSDFDHTFTLYPGSAIPGAPALVKWDDDTLIASLQPGDILIVDTDFTFDFEIIESA